MWLQAVSNRTRKRRSTVCSGSFTNTRNVNRYTARRSPASTLHIKKSLNFQLQMVEINNPSTQSDCGGGIWEKCSFQIFISETETTNSISTLILESHCRDNHQLSQKMTVLKGFSWVRWVWNFLKRMPTTLKWIEGRWVDYLCKIFWKNKRAVQKKASVFSVAWIRSDSFLSAWFLWHSWWNANWSVEDPPK